MLVATSTSSTSLSAKGTTESVFGRPRCSISRQNSSWSEVLRYGWPPCRRSGDHARPEKAVDVGRVPAAEGGDGRLADLVEAGLGLAPQRGEHDREPVGLQGVGERGHEAAEAEVLGELHQHLERGPLERAARVVRALVVLRGAVTGPITELLVEAREAEGDERRRLGTGAGRREARERSTSPARRPRRAPLRPPRRSAVERRRGDAAEDGAGMYASRTR